MEASSDLVGVASVIQFEQPIEDFGTSIWTDGEPETLGRWMEAMIQR